ncbi:hypothetical protein Syun_023871 [Stephania yunnanensis]|uniref:Protein SHORT HYPOCOTYL IN WHITE LIGHT 1 n=1 Tax=Stephania yunnanensis TaxID=152371 RepID=A0AAP0F9Q5_9MAGN
MASMLSTSSPVIFISPKSYTKLPLSLLSDHTKTRITNPRSLTTRHARKLGLGVEEALEEETGKAQLFDFDLYQDEEEAEEDGIDEEEDEETESSVDLLIRFLRSMFKKVSKRAKKATRSMLPPAFSPQLVSFAVDGVLILMLLSIAKALLEVVCTLGGSVFSAVLLLRVIWATAYHFQSIANSFNDGSTSSGSPQPVT